MLVEKSYHNSCLLYTSHAYFIGAMTKYSELVTHTVTVHMLGIRFLPCGILRFMDLPLQELTNLDVYKRQPVSTTLFPFS